MKKLIGYFAGNYLYKIRYQLVLLLIFVTVLPIISIQLINFSKTSAIILNKNQAILNDNLLISTDNLNNVLADYKQILFNISTDASYMENILLLDKAKINSNSYTRICEKLETCVKTNIILCPEVQAVGIISTSGNSYIYAQKREKTLSIIDYFNNNISSLKTNSISPTIGVISHGSSYYNKENPTFYLSVSSIHSEKMKLVGSIILFINPEKLNNIINNSTSEIYDFTNRMLVNYDDYIICSKNGLTGYQTNEIDEFSDIKKVAETNKGIKSTAGDLVSMSDLDYFNLKFFNIIDYNLLNKSLNALWSTIIWLMIAILFITLIIAFLVCRKFIFSLERVAIAMKSIDEDNLDCELKVTSKNEVRYIEQSYNQMLRRIKALLEENKSKADHIIEINKKACDAELKSLELQINPHFIFNTIDTINWTAIQSSCFEVSEQLNQLAYILRYTVYNMNQLVPMKEELQWVESYLNLQKNRFHNKFSYDIFVDEAADQLKIHKLLLQPILENSILHGFEDIAYHGYLRIDCNILQHRFLLIQITDNGRGIPPEKLKEIHCLFSYRKDIFTGVGLSNIAYRFQKYYPDSKIIVTSNYYNTCFKLFIPIREMR